jgi:hypothetical protein
VRVQLASGRIIRARKTRANAGCGPDEPTPVKSAVLALNRGDRAAAPAWTAARVSQRPTITQVRMDTPATHKSVPTDAQRRGLEAHFQARARGRAASKSIDIDQSLASDIDGDGRVDQIYAVSRNGGEPRPGGLAALVVELAAQPGVYHSLFPRAGAAGYQVIAISDVDGDGRAEILALEDWINDEYLRVIEFGSPDGYKIGCGMV